MTPLLIRTDSHCLAEKQFVADWVFGTRLGLAFELMPDLSEPGFEIRWPDQASCLKLSAAVFARLHEAWQGPDSLPAMAEIEWLELRDATGRPLIEGLGGLPDLAGQANGSLQTTEERYALEVDLLGSIFVTLTGYAETLTTERDEHDRVCSQHTWLGKQGLLDRPIVDEMVEVLGALLRRLSPGLPAVATTFRILPSHDIDLPSLYARSGWQDLARHLAGPLLRRGRLAESLQRWQQWSQFRRGRISADPYDCLDWLMDQSEAVGTTSTFYYIPESTDPLDPALPLDHPVVVDQWQRISRRGHRLGVHPGYRTYRSAAAMQSGCQRFLRQRDQCQIPATPLLSRQHYLRWSTPETAALLEAAGVAEDATLGFADRAGFRCGTCHRFPMYDLQRRQPLKLWQQPLVAMDCSVVDDRYMGLGLTAEAHHALVSLKRQCQRFGGDFSLLWHNTELQSAAQREFYVSVLQS